MPETEKLADFQQNKELNNSKTPNKKEKLNPYRLMITIIITVSLSIGIYAGALKFFKNRPQSDLSKQILEFQRVIDNPGDVAFGNRDHILILCLGLDENRDEKGIGHTKGSRTDTIFILNLDRESQQLGILSIPRDTWIPISDRLGNNKVNSAYSEGFWEEYEKNGNNYEKAKAAGIRQARQTIENYMGIKFDYYAILKIKACKELVDALGGITVDVEKDMDYDDSWGKLHVHLKKGRQKLNGEQAVGYARFRHDEEGDWGRIRRQQQVISALVNELKKPKHVMHIPRLAAIFKNNLDTDLSLSQIADIAAIYKHFNKENLRKGVLLGDDDWAGGAMILVPRENEKKRLVRTILRDPKKVVPDDFRVRIINASTISGIGADLADKLKTEGYNVVEVTSKEGDKAVKTSIIDHIGNPAAATMLRGSMGYYITGVTREPDENTKTPADFTIILGNDYYDCVKSSPDSNEPVEASQEQNKPFTSKTVYDDNKTPDTFKKPENDGVQFVSPDEDKTAPITKNSDKKDKSEASQEKKEDKEQTPPSPPASQENSEKVKPDPEEIPDI